MPGLRAVLPRAGPICGPSVAIDGSKFRAVASAKRIMGERKVAEEAVRIDQQIAAYLANLDSIDASEPADSDSNRRLRPSRLSGHAAPTLMLWQRDLKAEDRTSLVEGELDARPMGKGAGSKPPSYNVQTAVDAATGLIVHHEVTTEPTDNRLLHPMAKATKDAVAANTLTVVADAGYSNGADAAACENDGITPCVPANRAVNNQGDFFDRTAFIYEPQTDSFRCPAGWCASKSSLESRASCIWPTIVRVARSSRDAPASSAASFKDTFTRTRFNA